MKINIVMNEKGGKENQLTQDKIRNRLHCDCVTIKYVHENVLSAAEYGMY